ncbi:uncharacterized protein LOC112345419 [Selaginella moellendorffii]|uniref:uncharacterized protein LOC112345419 n=1 Tax=Selaginella moellendorffii TaxID=88036 RepID=UPI000D1C71E3|nr:uncharacterized protein LOC112345419 [Selaginella moellendorffii]|eukprot:XP_024527896.1 uncharacterized protein LOC112345419 [Selaginella moellendorffii]
MRIDVVPAMVAGHRRSCWAGPRCVSSGTGLQPARYIRWCRVQVLSSPRFLRYANIEKFGLAFGVTMRRQCLDDLPDEVLIRIMSLLAWSRDLNPSSLVSKRWAQLARLVTHYSLESSSRDVEQGLIRWFGHNDLRQLSIRFQQSCTRWLHQIGKGLHSVTIYGGPQHKFEDFWSNISACQELRCLHVHVTQLGSTLGNATLPSPLLPNLLFLSFHRPINVTVLQQLLEICPSLLAVRMGTIVVSSPGTYVLKSRSLDSCQSEFCEGDGRDNFTLALDTPKLRWMFFVVPRIQLQPTTCNVEWIRVRESMRHIQGLRYSRLKKIIFLNPFSSPAQVMDKVALCRTLSLKKFYFCIFDDGIPPCSIDLVALLEPFQGLEEFIVSFISIKVKLLLFVPMPHGVCD